MRAIVVTPPTKGAVLREVPEPDPLRGELKVRVLEVGVCGTDRDIVDGHYGTPPDGRRDLILGHENLGEVDTVGRGVAGWQRGDLVVATVRRGCGACRFCRTNQSDFCETGRFQERGIHGRDGYLAEFYVDEPEYLVRVPATLRSVAVLLEPLSVVEKAYLEGRHVLDRRGSTPGQPEPTERRALVAGTGAIGILAAFLLRSEGYEVTAIDRHGDDTPAASVLRAVGARHVNAADGLAALEGARYELVLEASGSAPLDFDLLRTLGRNGVLVLTGIPSADRPPILVAGGALLREVVLENQAIVGSVNANRTYFELGIRHLQRFRRLWGETIGRVITERRSLDEFGPVLSDRTSGAMKSVLVVAAR